jgi:hypothetical protein
MQNHHDEIERKGVILWMSVIITVCVIALFIITYKIGYKNGTLEKTNQYSGSSS